MTLSIADSDSTGRTAAMKSIDLVALALLAFAFFNLNGLALLLTGQKALLSLVVLPLVGFLFLRYASRSYVCGVHYLLSAFFLSYLLLGFLMDPFASDAMRTLQTYLASFLLIVATAFWLSAIPEPDVWRALQIFKHTCIASCALTVVSALVGVKSSYYSETERFSGLFENPDEAAMIALYGLVAILSLPARARIFTIGQLAVVFAALVLTFSKSGVLLAGVITLAFAARTRSPFVIATALLAWALCFVALWIVYDQNLIALTIEQRERLGELFGILAGHVDSETTTGRTLLLDIGLERIWKVFPGGEGLGRFHFLEGGFRNPAGDWLGIHNTYLMVLGEAGVIPAVLLMLLAADLFRLSLFDKRYRGLPLGFWIVLFGNMLSTHHALALRFHDMALGVILALVFRSRRHYAEQFSQLRHATTTFVSSHHR